MTFNGFNTKRNYDEKVVIKPKTEFVKIQFDKNDKILTTEEDLVNLNKNIPKFLLGSLL